MAGFEQYCDSCGGKDELDLGGRYTLKHNCEHLNTNKLLERIALSLESIERYLS